MDLDFRIAVASDLHLELRSSLPIPDIADFRGQVDLVVLAGDIAKGSKAVAAAAAVAASANAPVAFVAGNHEFYDGRHPKVIDAMRSASRELGVHYLENDRVNIHIPGRGSIRVLGATLWTSWTLRGDPEAAAAVARRSTNDYRYIRAGDGSAYVRFLPRDASDLHAESVRFLQGELAMGFAGLTVVVTHHAPSERSLPPRDAALIDAADASALDHLLVGPKAPDLWVHGHTHHAVDWEAAPGSRGTRVVSNPRGYAPEKLTFAWKIVEIGSR